MPSPFFFEEVPYFGSLTGTPVSTTPSTGVPVPAFLAQLIGPYALATMTLPLVRSMV